TLGAALAAHIMTQHQYIRFALNLSYDQYFKVYQGVAKNVSVVADDGRRIAFPAGRIQSFLTKQGINGYFEMEFTPENKFISIKKLK
ncbi:MAG: DUF2835 domain-containing protein, partial [Methylobacter sp.]